MITERQKKLMIAIIEEFMSSATPIGSEDLKQIYNFEFSPATIRNELADLAKEGYLFKEHSSSGRSPTTMAWRYYVSEILQLEDFNPINEAQVREKVFQYRFSLDRLIKESTDAIADFTGYTGVGIIENNFTSDRIAPVYLSGTSNLLEHKEFHNYELLKKILTVIENSHILHKIFSKSRQTQNINILIGEEIGLPSLKDIATIYAIINIGERERMIIGAIGPIRMNYSKVIPAIRAIANGVKDATIGW
jgi:transcriptional regulator of heat shock response